LDVIIGSCIKCREATAWRQGCLLLPQKSAPWMIWLSDKLQAVECCSPLARAVTESGPNLPPQVCVMESVFAASVWKPSNKILMPGRSTPVKLEELKGLWEFSTLRAYGEQLHELQQKYTGEFKSFMGEHGQEMPEEGFVEPALGHQPDIQAKIIDAVLKNAWEGTAAELKTAVIMAVGIRNRGLYTKVRNLVEASAVLARHLLDAIEVAHPGRCSTILASWFANH